MLRIAVLLAIACLIFGVGGVLGAGGHLFNTAKGATQAIQAATPSECKRPEGVVDVGFNKDKYPHIRRHELHALRDGWPEVLTIKRKGADQRRDHALEGRPTKPGYDRDEYPPAVGRSKVATDVELVPSSENRSHGAALGIKLRRYCDGTRFRYVWY